MSRAVRVVEVATLAALLGCGGATANDPPPIDSGSTDTALGLPDVAEEAPPIEDTIVDVPTLDVTPVEVGPKASRCKITDTTVFCEHVVTSFAASDTVRRDVYWQTPLSPKPAAGYPVVLLFQGSFGSPALTWATLAKGTPFGGFHQGLLQARLLDEGFIAIAPSAAAGSVWQTNAGIPWDASTDHVLMQALIAAIAKGTFGPANMKRLYATGISSGGYMTSRMAVSYAGVFRALAINSGSYANCLGPVCMVPDLLPKDHPPTLFLHGGADLTVPIATMKPYFDKLKTGGFDTDQEVDPSAGHEWLATSPKRIVDWFRAHE